MKRQDRSVMESEIERYLTGEVEKRGGQCLKFLPDYARGMPDRIVLLPGGVSFWAETKRPVGGVLEGFQLLRHLELRRLGQRVEVIWCKGDTDRLMQEYDRQRETATP